MQQFLHTVLNAPNQFIIDHHINAFWAIVIVLAEFVALYVIGLFVFTLIRNIPLFVSFALRAIGVGEKEMPQSFLELTFPATTTKSAFATEQLHILLRSLVAYRGFWDKHAARKKPYSLEIVGTNDDGIR